MESQWKNDKHRKQWRMTLTNYCKPIAQTKVSKIDIHKILSVLQPIWQAKPETTSRLRGRIERVLDFATIHGWREGSNPALWRGNLKSILPARQRLSRGHHAAISFKDLPTLIQRLDEVETTSAKALMFLILTAARTGEVINASWDEIDEDEGIWTIPAHRMKASLEHRVPLTITASSILKSNKTETKFIFPGGRAQEPLSNMAMSNLLKRLGYNNITVHGMRSTFRDWVGDETSFPREIAEAALAHRIGDTTEQAYRRQDALNKRRRLMEAWEVFLMGQKTGNVIAIGV